MQLTKLTKNYTYFMQFQKENKTKNISLPNKKTVGQLFSQLFDF